jgi:murein DD-endopeptidase MepM/ murein hydrolase activator NlpD
MKTILKIAVVAIILVLIFIADVPILPVQLVHEADAVMGVRRRTRRRTAVVVGSSVRAADSAQISASQQQAAAAEQEAAAAKQEAAAAKQEAAAAKQQAAAAPPAPPPAATGKPLPLGTVVTALPAGCTPTPVGGVEYYYCGGNFYRAAFQGNKLVYVTTKPE